MSSSSFLSPPPPCNYDVFEIPDVFGIPDVFLSFRGEDTRKTIVSHLYAALWAKGIHTFKDDQGLEKGNCISNQLRRAIEGSKFAVVVLSENYASSRWCLMELQFIIELFKLDKVKVFPIFYGVDPSDVRHQRGSFGLERYQGPEMEDIVCSWKDALNIVANLSGVDSRHCADEAMMLEEIVEDISSRLAFMQPTFFEDLVGMDAHIEHMNPLLNTESDAKEVRMVGIWGMGGIGKTTIARYLYEQLARHFSAHCFIEDVGQICRNYDLKYIQNQLLCDILSTKQVALTSMQNGAKLIRTRLRIFKALIVLDGVDKLDQLHALAKETSWFGPGSRIIITTRDKELLDSCGVTNLYEVKCLQSEESLNMLKKNAFAGGVPPFDAYERIAIRASQLARGLPLALVAFGSYLRGTTSIDEWEDAINALETAPRQNIMEILKSSYTNLDLRNKTIFIRVACLFNGEPVSRVSALLSETERNIKSLADKSLIHISNDGSIDMHSLIQQMGREIVVEESMYRPQHQRILWDPLNSYRVLESKTGTEKIEGLALHMCELTQAAASVDKCAFEQMHNLIFLKFFKHLDDIESKLDFSSANCMVLPRGLRLLHWDAYPLTTFPPRFPLCYLVELHLRYSKLESLWDGKAALLELRMLDVTGSKNLTKLPDVSCAPKLEELIAKGCTRLEQIPKTIVISSPKLKKLDISYCDRFLNQYMIVGDLPVLQKPSPQIFRQVSLHFHDDVVTLNSLTNLSIHGKICIWLSHLRGKAAHLSFSSEQCVPSELMKTTCKKPKLVSEFHGFTSLNIMQFNYNKDSAAFQCHSFSNFICLTELNLINLNIESIPDDIGLLHVLQKLDLSGNDFVSLPSVMSDLSSMKSLRLCNCLKLLRLPTLRQLETLKLSDCMELHSLLEPSAAKENESINCLQELWLDNCNNVWGLSDKLSHCTNLTYLDLSRNDMVTMPASIILLPLGTLCLNDCKKLKSLAQISSHLTHLYARGCSSLETIYLPLDHSIKHFDLSYCPRLIEVERLISRFLRCGRKEERFSCFSGSIVPSYFNYQARGCSTEISLPQMWHASESVGFNACIIVACQSPYQLHFSSSSYSCKEEDNRSYKINLKPDFFLPRESSSSSEEGETVSTDHMLIFHVPRTVDMEEFCLTPHLEISDKFQFTAGRIKSYGVRVIHETEEDDDPQYDINSGYLSKKRRKGNVDGVKEKDDEPNSKKTTDLLE